MLNRAFFAHHVPKAEREIYYCNHLPNQMRRMQVAEQIAKTAGLFKGKGWLSRKPIILILARCLFDLERERLIHIDSKLRIIYQAEPINIFEVLANALIEQRKVLPQEQAAKAEIEKIKKACAKIFIPQKEIPPYEETSTDRLWPFWNQLFLYPVAKDIIAGRHFNELSRYYFQRSASDFLPRLFALPPYRFIWEDVYRLHCKLVGVQPVRGWKNMPLEAMLRRIVELESRLIKEKAPAESDLYRWAQVLQHGLERYQKIKSYRVKPELAVLRTDLVNFRRDLETCLEFEGKLNQAVTETRKLRIKDLRMLYELRFKRGAKKPEGVPAELEKLPCATITLMREVGIQADRNHENIFPADPKNVRQLKMLKNILLTDDLCRSLRDDYEIVFVVSDLHLQKFQHHDTFDLLRFLFLAAKIGAKLIFDGDTYDLWRAGSIRKIIVANRLFFNALKYIKNRLFIRGNHDRDVPDLLPGMFIKEWNAFIEHGEINDPANRSDSNLGKAITRGPVRLLESIFHARATKALEYLLKMYESLVGWLRKKEQKLPMIPVIIDPPPKMTMAQLTLERIREQFREHNDSKNPFSPTNQFVYIMGHVHAPGVEYFYREMIELIQNDPELSGRVKFILTSSWMDNEAGAGGVVCLARKKNDLTAPVMITPFIWDYLTALEIVRNYA